MPWIFECPWRIPLLLNIKGSRWYFREYNIHFLFPGKISFNIIIILFHRSRRGNNFLFRLTPLASPTRTAYSPFCAINPLSQVCHRVYYRIMAWRSVRHPRIQRYTECLLAVDESREAVRGVAVIGFSQTMTQRARIQQLMDLVTRPKESYALLPLFYNSLREDVRESLNNVQRFTIRIRVTIISYLVQRPGFCFLIMHLH